MMSKEMTDKERFESFIQLADSYNQRVQSRLRITWQIVIGIWVVLLFAITNFPKDSGLPWYVILVPSGFHLFALYAFERELFVVKTTAVYFYEKAMLILSYEDGCDRVNKADKYFDHNTFALANEGKDSNGRLLKYQTNRHVLVYLVQILITFTLSILVFYINIK
jgi:hypothetical protein